MAIKKTFPQAEIVWAVDRRFAGIPQLCRSIDQVFVPPKEKQNLKSAIRALGEFDYGLDLQGLAKSASLIAMASCQKRLGYHWQREGAWLVSQPVLPDPTSIHVVDQYVDVARAMGAECHRAEFDLVPDPADIQSVQEKLISAGWDCRSPLVLLNAGAGWATKRWPAKNFAHVAHTVHSAGGKVAFLGTEADRAAFEEVSAFEPGPVIDFLGKSSVRELVALISLSAVHLAGDTGSTHIAAALGQPAIGTYTITRPERSCPYGQIQNCDTNLERVTEMVVSHLTEKSHDF
ncbi:glycosyltransferase family 9 protein [Kamptonema cortianum]|nr:glycosyltransferase family 9 protein [Geitlerinema splendidum]MDK3157578.1 glycosyltransferase family 9 protein [Kamptonema cortianum]